MTEDIIEISNRFSKCLKEMNAGVGEERGYTLWKNLEMLRMKIYQHIKETPIRIEEVHGDTSHL